MATKTIRGLPNNLKEEGKELLAAGVNTWEELSLLHDKDISKLVRAGRSTPQNLKRLRGIANLICELDIAQEEAALLMHAGFASVKALANSTPQKLMQHTGRLERQLNSGRRPMVDLEKANSWIELAKSRQKVN